MSKKSVKPVNCVCGGLPCLIEQGFYSKAYFVHYKQVTLKSCKIYFYTCEECRRSARVKRTSKSDAAAAWNKMMAAIKEEGHENKP